MNAYATWITQFTEKKLTRRKQKIAYDKALKQEKKTIWKEFVFGFLSVNITFNAISLCSKFLI